MTKTAGKIIEVYLPDAYQNGSLLDVMDRTNVGFKIMTKEGLKDIVLEVNETNAQIMKNDNVVIIEKDMCGSHFVDIGIAKDDSYE